MELSATNWHGNLDFNRLGRRWPTYVDNKSINIHCRWKQFTSGHKPSWLRALKTHQLALPVKILPLVLTRPRLSRSFLFRNLKIKDMRWDYMSCASRLDFHHYTHSPRLFQYKDSRVLLATLLPSALNKWYFCMMYSLLLWLQRKTWRGRFLWGSGHKKLM